MLLKQPINSMTDEVGVLTTKQAARYLSISTKWLANQRWQGTGPRFLKLGGAVRYRQADLDAYLARCEIKQMPQGDWSD